MEPPPRRPWRPTRRPERDPSSRSTRIRGGRRPTRATRSRSRHYGFGFGLIPAYYSWYNPERSTASVTYVAADGSSKTHRAGGATATYVPAIQGAIEGLAARPDAGSLVEEGVASFRARDYQEANDRLRRAVPLQPDNGLVRFQYGLSQFALGDYEGAAYSLRRGLDLLPEWVRSGQSVVAQYGDEQDFLDHCASLRSHLRIYPDDVESRVVLGYVEFLSGRMQAADEAFARVAEARPDDPIAGHFRDEIRRIRDHVAH